MKKKIINTGRHLPRATYSDQFELWQNRTKIVEKPIQKQSRKDKTILYGAYAVNQQVHPTLRRQTYDFDIYSHQPRHHAIQLEKSIDRGVNADLAYVQKTYYTKNGKKHPLYRVKTRLNDITEADYNTMPKNIQYTTKQGIRYETLNRAEKKYDHMLDHPEYGRGFNANIDRARIRIQKRGIR